MGASLTFYFFGIFIARAYARALKNSKEGFGLVLTYRKQIVNLFLMKLCNGSRIWKVARSRNWTSNYVVATLRVR